MSDPKEPEHEPESEELRALLSELRDEHVAAEGGEPLRLSPRAKARPRRSSADAIKQALFELYDELLPGDRAPLPIRAPLPKESENNPPTAGRQAPLPALARPIDPEVQRARDQGRLAQVAARVLVRQTPRNADEQQALGIPDSALTPDIHSWFAAVQGFLKAQPPERIFDAWVATLDQWSESALLTRLAIDAAAQLTTIAPYVLGILGAQRRVILQRSGHFVAVLRAMPVDSALAELLAALLQTLERRSEDEQRALGGLAGNVARDYPELAKTIASEARKLRELPPQQQYLHLPAERALATAVRLSGLPALVPTATLGLTTGYPGAAKDWAQALARCDSRECLRRLLDPERGLIGHCFGLDHGTDVVVAALVALPAGTTTATLRRSVLLEHPDPYLRIAVAYQNPDARGRLIEICAILASLDAAPGWVALQPQRDKVLRFMQQKYVNADWHKLASRYGRPLAPLSPPLTPLQAVTSRHTDLRHRALRNLAQEGKPEHLLAALLAADLDRTLELRGHPGAWRFISWGRWPALKLAALDHRWTGRGLTGLLALVRSLTRLGILGEQQLTPELAELQRLGPREFADRYPGPERLPLSERGELQAAEAAFIKSVPDRPN